MNDNADIILPLNSTKMDQAARHHVVAGMQLFEQGFLEPLFGDARKFFHFKKGSEILEGLPRLARPQ